ncbi:hypothetical protein F511_30623 [Dorcoceras hygrometricum]|uniref:Uncharacterized protein n=1 Tax=Dorcoceras hygrometricum TaxID=472368 RepID=A0A2Z7AGU1_9LAMI|nr:hypothetical protein F511_30623 [Dorcoceras hygrometricum]
MAAAAATMLRAALGLTPAASCAEHGAGCANQRRKVFLVAGSRSRSLARRSSTAAQQSGHHARRKRPASAIISATSCAVQGQRSSPLRDQRARCLVSYLAGVLAPGSDQFHEETGTSRVFSQLPCWRLGAWLRPVSRGNRHFTVGGGRLRQSGPRPKGRLLRQPALEGLTRSAWTETPQKVGRNKFRRGKAAAAARGTDGGREVREEGGGVSFLGRTPKNPPQVLNTLSLVSVRESRIQYLCDLQWLRDTASRGPTTIVAPESQFRTCPSDHDSIGYARMSASGESSTTMHRLLHASGSHPIPPPNDPNTTKTPDLSTRQMVTTWKVRTRVFR